VRKANQDSVMPLYFFDIDTNVNEISLILYSSIYIGLGVVSFLQVFPPKPCVIFQYVMSHCLRTDRSSCKYNRALHYNCSEVL